MKIVKLLIPLLVVVSISGLGVAGFFYFQYQKSQKELQSIRTDPSTLQKAAQAETKNLIDEVGRLIALPSGENPTVATITDIEKLKDQPFFKNARNGHKVLIYTNAKKAILYDSAAKKVIDVAPVNIGSSSAQPALQAKIILRNGTKIVGLAAKVESEIKKNFPQSNISAKDNAAKDNFEKTVVIILNDSAKEAANNLAKSLNASVVSLPDGEKKPDGDILIIIGSDKTS